MNLIIKILTLQAEENYYNMKSLKYIFILLFAFGCNDRDFDNPYDPMAEKNYNINLSYSGSGLSQLRIDNSNIEKRSFKCYEIYFSEAENFMPAPENLFLRITNWDSTSVSITSLNENENYYFIVKFVDVMDRVGFSQKINILTANKVPGKPIFSDATKVYLNQIEFVWYTANIKDFQKYEFYFSELKNFPVNQWSLYKTNTNILDTALTIVNLKPNTEYYYRLRVYDRGNLYSDSGEEVLKTGNDIPTKVTIEKISDETESSLSIYWSKNEDYDFLRYEIHYSTTQNFTVSSSTLFRNITDQNTVSYTVSSLTSLTRYYFKIRVVDKENGFIDSEELSGVTLAPAGPDVPNSVNILNPINTEISETSIIIRWDAYQNPEFAAHEIHYSVDPNFVPSSSTLFIKLSNVNTTNITVRNLTPLTTYYFIVRVFNTKDKFSDSKRVSATTK